MADVGESEGASEMQMMPPYVGEETVSSAERQVFSMLKRVEDDDDVLALHSLALSEHHYKRVAELDFVIVGSGMILVLEVKGGGISRKNGIWAFLDRKGRSHHSSEGPFEQARSGMYSLKERLEKEMPNSGVNQIVFGYGVVFPDCDFSDRSVEWSSEMIIDASRIRSVGFPECLRLLSEYWDEKHGGRPRADGRVIARAMQFMRRDFERVRSLANVGDDLERQHVRLTEEQLRHLDLVVHNNRFLCEGGAGTGKTFLALEIARRHAAEGESVLFTCRSRNLATFLRRRAGSDDITVLAYDDLVDLDEQFDVLVVDEGQDLMSVERFLLLGSLLRGDLQEGTWRIFYDANNQSGVYDEFELDALASLEAYGATSVRLRANCRNTNSIVLQTKLLTGADIGTASFGAGPPVEYRYYDDRSEQVALLASQIKHLYDEGVSPRDITILSPLPYAESVVTDLPDHLMRSLVRVEDLTNQRFPPNGLSFSTIEAFKGLENQHVLVVDIEDLDGSKRARSELYVAMTRPRVSLWIALPSAAEGVKSRIELSNLEGVLGDAGRGD